MSNTINNAGTPGAAPVPTTDQRNTPSGTVNQQDADDFASQMNEDVVEGQTGEQVQKNELLELMRTTSYQQFSEKQKEMVEEMKKELK